MNVGRPELSRDLVALIAQTVDGHLDVDSPDRDNALLLCVDAVLFAREYAEHGAGQRARAAAGLLLELGCAGIEESERNVLAVACELAAIGAVGR